VLLVEQNARRALELAHRGLVMELGAIRYDAPAADLLADPRVRALYLGG
jgi:branched-chain amino acid transport system ATP-binding protein